LLLLTNDGRVPNAVLRAATRHSKTYAVRTHMPATREQIARLAAGVIITTVAQRDGVAKPLTARTRPCEVKREYGVSGGCSLLFTLQEGRNRQIRRMLDAVGLNTITLHRTSFMSIGLDGLKPGQVAPLSEEEMRDIRRAVRAAAASGQDGAAGWGNDYVEEPGEARDGDGDED
jgi:pseudouridine synthase